MQIIIELFIEKKTESSGRNLNCFQVRVIRNSHNFILVEFSLSNVHQQDNFVSFGLKSWLIHTTLDHILAQAIVRVKNTKDILEESLVTVEKDFDK